MLKKASESAPTLLSRDCKGAVRSLFQHPAGVMSRLSEVGQAILPADWLSSQSSRLKGGSGKAED
jgi:hypothetical protein